MLSQVRKLSFTFFTTYYLLSVSCSFSQSEINIVDPYQMKVSRSKQADTFYFTQNASANIESKKTPDTLRSYNVFLEERITPFGIAYICNGNEITKKKYTEFKQFWNASSRCKPCLLYTYDDKIQLKYVAFQYQDCLCGTYAEYYNDGALKVKGQFKKIEADNWESIQSKNVCNIRDAVWTYYFPDGTTEKTETYVNGILKETIMPDLNSTPYKKTTTQSKTSDETLTSKKGLILRLKEKNKSTEE